MEKKYAVDALLFFGLLSREQCERMHQLLTDALAELDERERRAVMVRHGEHGSIEHTDKNAARILGMTLEDFRCVYARAIWKLHRMIACVKFFAPAHVRA